MADSLTSVVQKLVALAGGDPTKVRLPAAKGKVRVRTQIFGRARIIIVEPRYGGRERLALLDSADDAVLGESGVGAEEIRLHGLLIMMNGGSWLVMRAGWSVPLVGCEPNSDLAETLKSLIGQRVRLRGLLDDRGLVVTAVEEHREA